MNIQAMMKQAQNLQKEMMKVKEEIDSTEFKEVVKIEIDKSNSLDADDLEMLEDMIVVAMNTAMKKVDEMTEKKMGKFGNIPGLF